MHRKHFYIPDPGTVSLTLRARTVVFGALLALFSSAASADTSATVSVVSDYRFRGESMSQGNPEAQLSLSYDATNGWYAGAFTSGVDLLQTKETQLLIYTGYARTLASGWSWDLGVTDSRFSASQYYDYTEWYAGLSSENLNAKIYFSPNYFGENVETAYAELNASYPIGDLFKVLAHVGCLYRLSDNGAIQTQAARYDEQIGIGKTLSDWNFRLAWVNVKKSDSLYPSYTDNHSRTWIFSTSYSF